MPRLIEADAAKAALTGWETDPTDEEIEYTIDNIPTVDADEKIRLLEGRIAELESQVVRMRYHDDQITQHRVFEIAFSKLLNPEEAMDIFLRNVKRIFERSDHGE